MPPKTPPSLLTSLTRPSRIPTSRLPLCHNCALQLRHAGSSTSRARPVPKPTPFVPDVATFLSLIGRSLSTHSSKIESWSDLFTASGDKLKKRGLEPARTRRYLLRWREKFRNGIYGIGGDLKHVDADGIAELRVVELPRLPRADGTMDDPALYTTISTTPGMQKVIVNVPRGSETYVLDEGETTADLKKPMGMKLRENRRIVGSYVQPVKGSDGAVATIKVTEGMWEEKVGRKVHGGERRRAEVLHKARIEEGRKARR